MNPRSTQATPSAPDHAPSQTPTPILAPPIAHGHAPSQTRILILAPPTAHGHAPSQPSVLAPPHGAWPRLFQPPILCSKGAPRGSSAPPASNLRLGRRDPRGPPGILRSRPGPSGAAAAAAAPGPQQPPPPSSLLSPHITHALDAIRPSRRLIGHAGSAGAGDWPRSRLAPPRRSVRLFPPKGSSRPFHLPSAPPPCKFLPPKRGEIGSFWGGFP